MPRGSRHPSIKAASTMLIHYDYIHNVVITSKPYIYTYTYIYIHIHTYYTYTYTTQLLVGLGVLDASGWQFVLAMQ